MVAVGMLLQQMQRKNPAIVLQAESVSASVLASQNLNANPRFSIS